MLKRKTNNISNFNIRSKKGNAVLDTLGVLVFLIIFVISIYYGKYILSDLNDEIQSDPDMHNTSKQIVSYHEARYGGFFDGIFLLAFILFWALMLVASFNIDAHPIFFIFTFILMIFVFIVAAILGNLYKEFAEEEDMVAVVPFFPIAHYIMSHFLMVAIVVGFSIMGVLFVKKQP